MSNIEKLVVQIFERKKRIIDQANQQICSFDNYLCSKLLIDGIAPPPWLCKQVVHSLHSDPKELNKEDLLSEALILQSKHPYSAISHDLYSQFNVKYNGRNCSDDVDGAVHGLDDDHGTGSVLPVVPEFSVNRGRCASSDSHVIDSNALSPLHQAEDVSENDPSLSLARMQRSRSRQRAMELRNSAKLVRNCSRNENNVDEACPDFSVKSNNEGEVETVPLSDGVNKGCIVEEVGLTGRFERKNSFCCTERVTGSRSSAQRPNHAVNSLVDNEDGSFSKDAEKHSCRPAQAEIQCKLLSNVESKTLDQETTDQKVRSVASNDNDNSSMETSEEECQKSLIRQDESGKTLNHMLLVKEKCFVQSDLAAHVFLDYNKTNGEKNSSRNCNIIIQTSCDRLPTILVEDDCDDMRMHVTMEKLNGDHDMAKPPRVNFEESTLDSDVPVLEPSIAIAEFPALLQTHVSVIPDETIHNPLVKVPHATSDDERRVTITSKVPEPTFCYQKADFSFDKWVSHSKTDCCSNGQWSQKSLTRRSSTYNLEVLSSKKKRKKIEDQQANTLAMTTSLMENPQDSDCRNLEVSEYYIDGVTESEHSPNHQQNEGGHIDSSTRLAKQSTCTKPCFVGSTHEGKHIPEGKNSHAETLFTFSLNELEESLVSGLTEQRGRDSQSLLLDQIRAVDPVNTVSDVMQKCIANDGQLCFNLTFDHRIGSAKYVDCKDGTRKERSSSLGVNARLSCCSPPPLSQCMDMGNTSDTLPEFEGFLVHPNGFQPWVTEEKIGIGELKLPTYVTEDPTVLEQVRKSSFIHSPVGSLKMLGLREVNDLYRSVPNGLLEGMYLESSIPLKDESNRPHSDGLTSFKIHSASDVRNLYRSPVRTLWDDITLKYGSSGKRISSNPELPCINEEIEHADELPETFQKGIGSELITSSIRLDPLADIVNNANPTASVSQDEMYSERCSLESVKTNINFSGPQKSIKLKAEKQNGCRRKCTNKGKENSSISLGAHGANKSTSLNNRFSRPKLSRETGARKGGPSFSGTKPPRNNILSNVTSFIPLVQQKQAAAAAAGKRDFNVKALEAAEVKKRLQEKIDNERKIKKEALRVQIEKAQRERLEQENMKQLELLKKRKDDEQKRKDANVEAKKRQREEVERKERKRKHLDDTRKQQLEHGKKFCAKKDNKEIKCQNTSGQAQGSKDLKDERDMDKECDLGQDCGLKENPETECNTILPPTNDEIVESLIIHDSLASRESGCIAKVNCNMIKQKEDDNLCPNTREEKSYEISPFKESDDEDEDGDDGPHKKYVPLWASKQNLSLVVSSQHKIIPETIFSPPSFYNISEVLMPRQHRLT